MKKKWVPSFDQWLLTFEEESLTKWSHLIGRGKFWRSPLLWIIGGSKNDNFKVNSEALEQLRRNRYCKKTVTNSISPLNTGSPWPSLSHLHIYSFNITFAAPCTGQFQHRGSRCGRQESTHDQNRRCFKKHRPLTGFVQTDFGVLKKFLNQVYPVFRLQRCHESWTLDIKGRNVF